jgi:perosamine synthetase
MDVVHKKEMIPAIHGGQAVREQLLPYGHQTVDEDDIHAVVEVLRSDWITTGPKVPEFEEAFANFLGARFAVSFSSGTAALHGAAFAAGLGPGDEAITTPLTFCATANCILYQRAKPVFADIDPDTLNINLHEVARHITPRTRVLLPVDYAGHPADLASAMELAERHRMTVIEDACHALGSEYQGRRVGSISHLTVFSFHPVKHITTGEGGMVTTNDPELARKLQIFRNHGIDSDARQRMAKGQWFYQMVLLGYNYRLTDIGCALGLSQLKKLAGNLARRRQIAARYTAAFRGLAGVIPPTVRPDVTPSWHLYPIRLDLAKLRVGREGILRALRGEGVGASVHYIPVHLHPYYQEHYAYRSGQYQLAEAAYEQLLTLPLFHGMSDGDCEDVIEAVDKVVRYYSA